MHRINWLGLFKFDSLCVLVLNCSTNKNSKCCLTTRNFIKINEHIFTFIFVIWLLPIHFFKQYIVIFLFIIMNLAINTCHLNKSIQYKYWHVFDCWLFGKIYKLNNIWWKFCWGVYCTFRIDCFEDVRSTWLAIL